MPVSPPSLCTQPGCPNLVNSGKGGKCEDHRLERRREQERKRPSGHARGWTKQWAEFRVRYLAEHPYCECDEHKNLPVWKRPLATDIDHIDGTGRTGPRAYDETNLKALAHSCHSKKTYKQDGAFGRVTKPDTNPTG